ncbi:MAG: twin-arginine translocase TatA/TatE family subunit [Desulfoprunum sp.]|nr:twin-arginine translocase TatA/TatE family subunit [Desulfoprunum sp.]
MFGIGLPEMILILALALIVVGPDKLPDLARSLAKGILELKKTAEGLKASFAEEGNPLNDIRPELEDVSKSLKANLLDAPTPDWKQDTSYAGVNPGVQETSTTVTKDIDAEFTAVSPPPPLLETEIEEAPAPMQAPVDQIEPETSQAAHHGHQ